MPATHWPLPPCGPCPVTLVLRNGPSFWKFPQPGPPRPAGPAAQHSRGLRLLLSLPGGRACLARPAAQRGSRSGEPSGAFPRAGEGPPPAPVVFGCLPRHPWPTLGSVRSCPRAPPTPLILPPATPSGRCAGLPGGGTSSQTLGEAARLRGAGADASGAAGNLGPERTPPAVCEEARLREPSARGRLRKGATPPEGAGRRTPALGHPVASVSVPGLRPRLGPPGHQGHLRRPHAQPRAEAWRVLKMATWGPACP